MGALAAVLVVHMRADEAVLALSRMVRRAPMGALFRQDPAAMAALVPAFWVLLAERMPRVAAHLRALRLPLLPVLVAWWLPWFSSLIPLPSLARVWDALLLDFAKGGHSGSAGGTMEVECPGVLTGLFSLALAVFFVLAGEILGGDVEEVLRLLTRQQAAGLDRRVGALLRAVGEGGACRVTASALQSALEVGRHSARVVAHVQASRPAAPLQSGAALESTLEAGALATTRSPSGALYTAQQHRASSQARTRTLPAGQQSRLLPVRTGGVAAVGVGGDVKALVGLRVKLVDARYDQGVGTVVRVAGGGGAVTVCWDSGVVQEGVRAGKGGERWLRLLTADEAREDGWDGWDGWDG